MFELLFSGSFKFIFYKLNNIVISQVFVNTVHSKFYVLALVPHIIMNPAPRYYTIVWI